MQEYRFLLTHILPCKNRIFNSDRICSCALIQDNIVQWKPVFLHFIQCCFFSILILKKIHIFWIRLLTNALLINNEENWNMTIKQHQFFNMPSWFSFCFVEKSLLWLNEESNTNSENNKLLYFKKLLISVWFKGNIS